jgi:RNA recognition motif-containing protein
MSLMNPGLDNMTGYYSTSNETQQRQIYSTMSSFLFAADLPDGTCEEDLYGFFNGYNMISSKVISNINKTYAFVSFQTKNDAERARRELNGVTIQAKYASSINKVSKPVRLCRYESRNILSNIDPRCNLLVKNLSPQVSAHLLFNTFIKYGDVRSSKLMVDIMGQSKGFGFISYYRWEDSVSAIEHLNNTELGGKNIKINYLEKGRHHVVKRNNIYVKEIPKKNFSDKELIELFNKFGKINSAIVLKDEKGESKGFGFVCFEKPEDAEKAQKEMNGKKIFDDVENKLYVSFALKKAERKEELIKMKEKLFKESQKMTIYAKIQDDEKIKTEEEFKKRIMDYLQKIMGQDYKPKLIKVRIEQKNAFITMNNKEDAKEFIKKFQELVEEKNDIYFNTYKSKLERINAQLKFKNYNNFSETGSHVPSSSSSMRGGRVFKDYNNFGPQQMVPNQPQFPNPRNQGRPQFKNYNDFSNMNNNMNNNMNINSQFNQFTQNKKFVNYNNFNDNNLSNDAIFDNTYQELRRKMDKIEGIKDREQAGDFIFELAEAMYKEEAGKITGMILEYELDKVINMIINDPMELKKQINNGHSLIQTNK